MAYSFIDPLYDIDTIKIYDYFKTYFSNPRLKKIKENDSCYIYATRIKSLLGKNKRYLFVFVKKASTQGEDNILLGDVDWCILQTRTMEDEYNVPTHSYRETSLSEDNLRIRKIRVENDKTIYSCDEQPQMTVVLLNFPNQTRAYSDIGTLKLAIENYNSIFQLN